MKNIIKTLSLLLVLAMPATHVHPLTENDAIICAAASGIGVGAVASGLIYFPFQHLNHDNLLGKKIVSLSIGAMVAGIAGFYIYQGVFFDDSPRGRFLQASTIINKARASGTQEELGHATTLLNFAIEDEQTAQAFIDLCKKTLKEIEQLSLDLDKHASMFKPFNELFLNIAQTIISISLNTLTQDTFQTDADLFSTAATTASLANLRWPIVAAYNECIAMEQQLSQATEKLNKAAQDQDLANSELITAGDRRVFNTLYQKIENLSKIVKKHATTLQTHPEYKAQTILLEECAQQEKNRCNLASRIFSEYKDRNDKMVSFLVAVLQWMAR